MDFNDIQSLKDEGFIGFLPINKLRSDYSVLPKSKGVYIILNNDLIEPKYLKVGTGSFHKKTDPNVSIDQLVLKWIDKSLILYIGKATNLNTRIKQYLEFGLGKTRSHKGGRYIWQLENSQNLFVCWRTKDIDDPRLFEKSLIQEFLNQFGKRPFANING